MSRVLSWLDFAESDRQRAMQVIDLFREKNTVDELGLSPIRDVFADHFFPGTSTIQTRARYFLFLPWILLRYERSKLSVQERVSKLRMRETRLINALLQGCEDPTGIIGRDAQAGLQRMPSSVYWRGLRLWGIRLFDGSIEQYFRRLSRQGVASQRPVSTDDGEPLDGTSRNWHPALPAEPQGLFESTSLELRAEEAEFLRDRICTHQPGSVLACLVTCNLPELDSPFVWGQEIRQLLPPDLHAEIEHARLFAMSVWGGPLVYSLQLARMKPGSEELLGQLEGSIGEWQTAIRAEEAGLRDWDRTAFWELVRRLNPRISSRTQEFAETWIGIALRTANGDRVWDDSRVGQLIATRERQLKGGRARLLPENLRARDRWQGDVSGGPIDYRWGQTQVILNDILQGLSSGQDGSQSDA
jgi:hypothetical protein